MDMTTDFLEAIKPVVGDVADQNLGVFATIWYYITIPYNLFVLWPNFYIYLSIWWPVYVLWYYSYYSGLAYFDAPLWLYLLAYPDLAFPVFYFDFFYPPVTDETFIFSDETV